MRRIDAANHFNGSMRAMTGSFTADKRSNFTAGWKRYAQALRGFGPLKKTGKPRVCTVSTWLGRRSHLPGLIKPAGRRPVASADKLG